MIIKTKEGRRRSIRTKEEVDRQLGSVMERLSHEESKIFAGIINKDTEGFEKSHKELVERRYHTKPVSMEQFIEDPYYLGESCDTIWPALRKDLIDLFDYPYREFVTTGSIGVGKCVSKDTEIYDPVSGCRITVEKAAKKIKNGCASFNKENRVTEKQECFVVQSGFKHIGKLVMDSGKCLGLSPDHPVLTPWGFKQVGELKPGDFVATSREMPGSNGLNISDEEIKWVAYMLADGGSTQNSMTFTNESVDVHDDFELCTAMLSVNDGFEENPCSYVRMDGKAKTVRPTGVQWVRNKYNLKHKSNYKRVPSSFYGLDNRQLGLFINRIWACDGWICRRGKKKGQWEVGIALASEKFVRDIQQLLLRFGMHSRIRERTMHYTYKGEKLSSQAWSLSVLDAESICKFLNSVGEIIGKRASCIDAYSELKDIESNSNVDVTPMDKEIMKRVRREIGPISKKSWWQYPVKFVGNKKLRRMREMYDLPSWCDWWTDVFWERIESYTVGEKEVVYDIEVPETRNFSAQGIIVHNTYGASIAICRILYELSCLIDPQKTFGLSSGTEIMIPLVSKNLILARDIMKTAVDAKIVASPYFMSKYRPNIKKENSVFPHNIKVVVGSYLSDRILGGNVLAAFLDETNFPPKMHKQQIATGFGQKISSAHFDIVEKVYRGLLRRIKSRFLKSGGDFPGMIVLASSAATIDSFTERKIRDSREDPDVFIRDHAPWTAKPEENFSDEWFYMLCSTSSMKARILDEEDYENITDEFLIENDAWIMEVPSDYIEDFELDMENALRDIGGVSTQAISSFIQRLDAVDDCIVDRPHPFTAYEWVAGGPGKFKWNILCNKFERKLAGGFKEDGFMPRLNPKRMRWCHVDTSLSGDSSGMCVAHIDRWVEVVRRDGEGNRHVDAAPFYIVDMMLRINPPPAEQIYMPDIRQLLYQLIEHGYSFMGFSSDQFMYAEMHQQIKRRGVHCELISMDRTTQPYEELKSAIYENRIEYYGYAPFIEELKSLEYDRLVGKIDHPVAGRKDCLSGDTKIALLNGENVPIQELVGKEFYVYSCTEDGEIVPGKARNVHVVGERPVMRIWLDNGEWFDCTNDHEVMRRDGSFKMAQCLKEGDSVMPLYRDISKKNSKNGLNGYEKVLNNKTGKYEFTHQIVARKCLRFEYAGNIKQRMVLHHVDFNKRNNSPDNIAPMGWDEHRDYHNKVGKTNLKKLWEDDGFRKRCAERSSKVGKRTGPINITKYNKSDERIKKLKENGHFKRNGTTAMTCHWKDPGFRERHKLRLTGSNNPHYRKDITFEYVIDVASKVTCQTEMLIEMKCTQKVLLRVLKEKGVAYVDIAKRFGHVAHRKGSGNYRFRKDITFEKIKEIAKNVSTVGEMVEMLGCTAKVYARVLEENGYNRIEFRDRYIRKLKNHKIVKIEKNHGISHVFDMTVDVYHNFALSSGVFVHNCSDAVAGTIFGLQQGSMRLPPEETYLSQRAGGHEFSWVTNKIPADSVDLDDLRSTREGANGENFMMPILFGDGGDDFGDF